MKMEIKKTTILLCVISITLLIPSCSKEKVDWSEDAEVQLQFNSNFENGAEKDGRDLNIQSSNLRINAIHISGKTLQGSDVDVDQNVPFDANLVDNGTPEAAVKLPIGTYEELSVTFKFSQSENNNKLSGEIVKQNGQLQSKSLNMSIETPESFEIDVMEELSKELLTLEKSNNQMLFSFDLSQILEAMEPSLWNGIWIANQAQNNVDLSSQMGKSFVKEFSYNLFESVSITFEN